jgi:acyl-coenzyme A synthetase/AMP-(fatty) acid ligase
LHNDRRAADRVAHESVLEAVVVGVPDEDGFVKPEALVVVDPGVLAGEELARALCRLRYAPLSTFSPHALDRTRHGTAGAELLV